MKKVIVPTLNDVRNVHQNLGKERSTFRLTEEATNMLDALAHIEEATELDLLDRYATATKSDPFTSHFEKWLVRHARVMNNAPRHTRRLSSNTLHYVESLASKHNLTRDQVLQGLVEYWARWKVLDSQPRLAAIEKLIGEASKVGPVLEQLSEEARAMGEESLAWGQLHADWNDWEDTRIQLRKLLDCAKFSKEELLEFISFA